MPLYEYQCAQCGRFELIKKFSDSPVTACPTCGGEIQKLFSAPAIQFKGTGWYITDYARKSGGQDAGKSSDGDGSSASKDGGSKSAEGGSKSTEGGSKSTDGGSKSTDGGAKFKDGGSKSKDAGTSTASTTKARDSSGRSGSSKE